VGLHGLLHVRQPLALLATFHCCRVCHFIKRARKTFQ
jgi:hypothetical protein